MSEDDADMVILIRLRIKPHSWDIMRLDIHEPDLVSYPVEDNCGNEIWYSHSYSPWQVSEEFNDSDLKVDVARLPRDMYPVYKFYEEFKEGYRPIYHSGKVDPFGYDEGFGYNPWDVEEVNAGTDNLHEYVPIVGGENGTKFRVRTHEDLTKVTMYLVEGEYWYNPDMENAYGNLDTNPDVIDKITMVADDDDKRWGFWEWNIDDWADVNGHDLSATEATYTLAMRAYHSTVTDPRVFYEQFQWPIFLDTKGPEIEMFNVDSPTCQSCPTNPCCDWTYDHNYSYLDIKDRIDEGLTEDDVPYPVGEMVAMYVNDGGAIYLEEEKGVRLIEVCTAPPPPVSIPSVVYPAGNWVTEMKRMRAEDLLQNHKIKIKAGDTTTYERYWKQDLTDKTGSWRLGFPGNDTELLNTYVLENSLKYLKEPVDLEYMNRNSVLTERHMGYMNNIYSSELKKVFEGRLPEQALFHNINFEEYIWRNMGTPQQSFEVSVVDELNNMGIWTSYLRKYQKIDPIINSLVKSNPGDNRDGDLDLSISVTGEVIEKITLRELANGDIPNGTARTFDDFYPDSTVSITATGVLQPAYSPNRLISVSIETGAGYKGEVTVPLTALYAGEKPELTIEPTLSANIGNLYTELKGEEKDKLLPLLKTGEGLYVKNFDGEENVQFKTRFNTNDDNVDQYIGYYDVEAYDVALGATQFTDSLIRTNLGEHHEDYYPIVNKNWEYGYYELGLDAEDYAGAADISPVDSKIWYQNPKTFVKNILAVDDVGDTIATISKTATCIYVELQSDILYVDADDLMSSFSFMVNGVTLDIESAYDEDQQMVSGAGRSNEFWFTVSVFNPQAAMSRAITGVEGKVHYSIRNIVSPAHGANLDVESAVILEKPELVSPENGTSITELQPYFVWEAVSLQDGRSIYYDLYIGENDGTGTYNYSLIAEGLTYTSHELINPLVLGKTYKWFVVARDGRGLYAKSDVFLFTTGAITNCTLTVASAGNGDASIQGTTQKTITVACGTTKRIIATPYSGYNFNYWTRNGINIGGTAAMDVDVNQNVTYTAYFTSTPIPPVDCVPLSTLTEPTQYEIIDNTVDYGYWLVRIYPSNIPGLPDTGDYKLVIGTDEYTFDKGGGQVYIDVPATDHDRNDIISNGAICPTGEVPEVACKAIEDKEGLISDPANIWEINDALAFWTVAIHVPKFVAELPDFLGVTSFTLVLDGVEYDSTALTPDIHKIEDIPASYTKQYIIDNGILKGNQ